MHSITPIKLRTPSSCATLVVAASLALGDVPTYRVDVVATYSVTTTLRGASDAGHLVGDQVVGGASTPFVATLADGLLHLPLPAGYDSGVALGVNDAGVVVGAVDDSGFPFDLGEPAIWTPDGSGGYTVIIPQQFTMVDSPLGPLGVNGGMCVDINNNGIIAGWSRFQGFQGGPTTLFSTTGAPVNLQELGFEATVQAINDTGVLCGGQLIFDIATNTATDIGVPAPLQPGNVSFTSAIAFAINDSNEAVVAANLASVSTENWLTYTHSPADGYARVNPAELPAVFVGFYDNNDHGDVASSGGMTFKAEGVLETNIDNLIATAFSDWDVEVGFIDNNRRIATTAVRASTGENALVLLTPQSTGTCGTWERVSTPNPGTINNFFVDAEEANGTVYALLAGTDSTQVRPPLEWHVLRRDGEAWTDLGGPTNVDGLIGLEFNAIGVSPDGTVWVGGSFNPLLIGQNAAPIVASYDPTSGNWSAPQEVQIPDTVVRPVSRRPATIESIEVAQDGTVFASGSAGGWGGGQAGIDGSVPLFLINDGGGFVETFVAPFQDWPGGSGLGPVTAVKDAIMFAPDDVWLVGRHNDNGTTAGGLILHWDGSTLSVERGGNTAGGQFLLRDLGSVDGNATNDLRVAGQLAFSSSAPFGTLGTYNGTEWTLEPTPWLGSVFDPIQSFNEIVVADDGTAWASGVFAETQTPYYDGNSWSLKPFIPAPPQGSFVRITSMAEDGHGSLWAFGSLAPDGESYAVRLVSDCPVVCAGDVVPSNTDGSFGNGIVNIDDLLGIVNNFGGTDSQFDPAPANPDGSLGNGVTNIDDVLAVINAFGPCP